MLNAYAILSIETCINVVYAKKTSVENKTKRKSYDSFLLRSSFHLLLTSGLKAKTRDL